MDEWIWQIPTNSSVSISYRCIDESRHQRGVHRYVSQKKIEGDTERRAEEEEGWESALGGAMPPVGGS